MDDIKGSDRNTRYELLKNDFNAHSMVCGGQGQWTHQQIVNYFCNQKQKSNRAASKRRNRSGGQGRNIFLIKLGFLCRF